MCSSDLAWKTAPAGLRIYDGPLPITAKPDAMLKVLDALAVKALLCQEEKAASEAAVAKAAKATVLALTVAPATLEEGSLAHALAHEFLWWATTGVQPPHDGCRSSTVVDLTRFPQPILARFLDRQCPAPALDGSVLEDSVALLHAELPRIRQTGEYMEPDTLPRLLQTIVEIDELYKASVCTLEAFDSPEGQEELRAAVAEEIGRAHV